MPTNPLGTPAARSTPARVPDRGLQPCQFYLDRGAAGVLYIVFCWALIPAVVALFEAFALLAMSSERFDLKYNAAAAQPQVVVQMGSDTGAKLVHSEELLQRGEITPEGYRREKAKLLAK